MKTRFIMIGGFLGAGKTTTLARLAGHYVESGKNIGLVTNDQAYDLVDTRSLRAQGFDVGEVPGACFCCKFDDLVSTVNQLERAQAPHIVITEPVGSCTDLVATVIEPMRMLHGDQYELSPYVVLLKPEHGRKILRDEPGAGFSPKAAYIFLKQIEEADVVAINKVDKFSPQQVEELVELVAERYPHKRVVPLSARDGTGFDQLLRILGENRQSTDQVMDVDYDLYAEGEALMGWLNCTAEATATAEFPLDAVAVGLLQRVRDQLATIPAEPAHLKVLVQAADASAIANLVGSDVDVELSAGTGSRTSTAEVVINARVLTDPDTLEQVARKCLESLATDQKLSITVRDLQKLSPGRPVPTHRWQGG